ncbi:hypothetical protein AKO1_006166 [Acrasis kona]|uniref:Mitochondrial chaperone BCS1 n=1 Tax=Acrasis kona TaxID=1008807 RepID=A0AAW2YIA4_9EUKA
MDLMSGDLSGDSLISVLTQFSGSSPLANGTATYNATSLLQYINQTAPLIYSMINPTSQSSYLLWFIHIFFVRTIPNLLSNNIFSAGISIMVFSYAIRVLWDQIIAISDSFRNIFYYSMEFKSVDQTYQYLRHWLSNQKSNAKSFSVVADWQNVDNDGKNIPNVMFVPGLGSHYFKYKGYRVWVDRSEDKDNNGAISNNYGEPNERMNITIFQPWAILSRNTGKQALKMIIDDAMAQYHEKTTAQTNVYTVCDDYADWEMSCMRAMRPMESVVLPEKTKQDTTLDISNFLDDEKWYKDNGIPYRRGYLLFGAPGTGKTSFILALAAKFKLSVSMLSFSHPMMTDNFLLKLVNNSPSNTLLLLEDVDAAFVDRKSAEGKTKLTFSGVLNALDGVASQKNKLVFMTTNHIERLSPALIRPGRVDFKVEFKLANRHQIKNMFVRLFPKPEHEALAEKFSDIVPEYVLSPAELQGLFIKHKYNPEEMIEDTSNYLQELKDYKALTEKLKEQEKKDAEEEAGGEGKNEEKADKKNQEKSETKSEEKADEKSEIEKQE